MVLMVTIVDTHGLPKNQTPKLQLTGDQGHSCQLFPVPSRISFGSSHYFTFITTLLSFKHEHANSGGGARKRPRLMFQFVMFLLVFFIIKLAFFYNKMSSLNITIKTAGVLAFQSPTGWSLKPTPTKGWYKQTLHYDLDLNHVLVMDHFPLLPGELSLIIMVHPKHMRPKQCSYRLGLWDKSGWQKVKYLGSLYYQPKECTFIKDFPQSCHIFALIDAPTKRNFNDPWSIWKHLL